MAVRARAVPETRFTKQDWDPIILGPLRLQDGVGVPPGVDLGLQAQTQIQKRAQPRRRSAVRLSFLPGRR